MTSFPRLKQKPKRRITLLFMLCFHLLLTACTRQPQEKLYKKSYFIFGTIVEVVLWHDNDNQVKSALDEVEQTLNAMHHQWHAWKPGRLTKINQALRAGKSFQLTNEESQFIKQVQQLSQQSLATFNPAIGELIHLWGFHTDNYPLLTPPPRDSDIQLFLKSLPTMAAITIKNQQISSNNRHIWLDFGGVAKGYAIDKAIALLKKHGIKNAIVNAGGDLRSIGNKNNKNWRVAIAKPNSKEHVAIISVKGDESIFTSGNYERYKQFAGKRYAHIINPQTGYGVKHIVSATVIAENGTKADAAATAMVVAGTENWFKVAQSMQLEQVLLIDEKGQCIVSDKLEHRLEKSQLDCQVVELRYNTQKLITTAQKHENTRHRNLMR